MTHSVPSPPEPPTPPTPSGRWRSLARLGLGLAIFAGLVWALGASLGELRTAADPDPRGFLWSLAGMGFAALAAGARWKWIVEQMGGTRLRFGAYVHALVLTRLVGSFTSALAVDLVGRGLALQRAGSERSVGHTTAGVIVERIHDMVLPACLLPWALWAHDRPEVLALALLGFHAVATFGHAPLARLGVRAYEALRNRRRGGAPASDDAASRPAAPAALYETRTGALVALMSLGRYLGISVHVYGTSVAVGLGLEALETVAVSPPAQLSVLLGVTPGALGIQEIGWAAGLAWLGYGATAITLFMLAQRALYIVSFATLSALSWPWRRGAHGESPASAPSDDQR